MKKVILAVALSLVFCSSAVWAVEPYVSVGAGYVFLEDSDVDGSSALYNDTSVSFEEGYVFRGAIGARIDKNFRLELEGFYGENDTDDVNVMNIAELNVHGYAFSVTGAFINGYYDMNLGYPVVPYVGVGVGYANVELDGSDDDVFAYAVGVGVAYELNKTLAFDLGYRYMGTEDANIGPNSDLSYNSSQILAGVRVSF